MSAPMDMTEFHLFSEDPLEICSAVNSLQDAKCCSRCIFRFLGERNQDTFRNYSIQELADKLNMFTTQEKSECETNGLGQDQPASPCSACIGLLQEDFSSDRFLETVYEKITDEGFCQFEDYLCSITLPVAIIIRQHSLWVMLKSTVRSMYDGHSIDEIAPIKDVWKWINGPTLCRLLKVPFSLHSGFEIGLYFHHDELETECNFLSDLYPDVFRRRKQGRMARKRYLDIYNKTNVAKALKETSDETFKKHSRCPPKHLTSPCKCSEIQCHQSSLYLAGRYNKYSRTLSQTPWIIDGERKTESSVQELICDKLVERIKPDDHKFSSSGREDVDVRMLGRGRPFVVEFVNPRILNFSPEELATIQKEINSSSHEVHIRHLQRVSKEDVGNLKEGEEDKTKSYIALCWSQTPVTQSDLDVLQTMKDVELKQKTPIRVLHRRPLHVRSRTVHSLTAHAVDEHHFNLELVTQAGTYVKEFVHGDLGRTQPNLNTILKQECDILELDVKSVDTSWPKSIDGDNDYEDIERTKVAKINTIHCQS